MNTFFIVFYIVICVLFAVFMTLSAIESGVGKTQTIVCALFSLLFWPIVLLSLTAVMIIRACTKESNKTNKTNITDNTNEQ